MDADVNEIVFFRARQRWKNSEHEFNCVHAPNNRVQTDYLQNGCFFSGFPDHKLTMSCWCCFFLLGKYSLSAFFVVFAMKICVIWIFCARKKNALVYLKRFINELFPCDDDKRVKLVTLPYFVSFFICITNECGESYVYVEAENEEKRVAISGSA